MAGLLQLGCNALMREQVNNEFMQEREESRACQDRLPKGQPGSSGSGLPVLGGARTGLDAPQLVTHFHIQMSAPTRISCATQHRHHEVPR